MRAARTLRDAELIAAWSEYLEATREWYHSPDYLEREAWAWARLLSRLDLIAMRSRVERVE